MPTLKLNSWLGWRKFTVNTILRARATGSGERDRPVGTSEHANRVSDLLRRERVSVVVGIGVAFGGERASGVRRRRHWRAITTCVSDVRKKATLGGNQRRRVLRHEMHPIWSPVKETHPTSMCLQYEIIGNGLYSSLPIQQQLVTDISSPLLIGHWSVTDFTSPLPICFTFVTDSI
jgi:hypothetical protein